MLLFRRLEWVRLEELLLSIRSLRSNLLSRAGQNQWRSRPHACPTTSLADVLPRPPQLLLQKQSPLPINRPLPPQSLMAHLPFAKIAKLSQSTKRSMLWHRRRRRLPWCIEHRRQH